MFMWHNETINVWSHFLGKLLYIYVFYWICINYPNMEQQGQTIKNQLNAEIIRQNNFT